LTAIAFHVSVNAAIASGGVATAPSRSASASLGSSSSVSASSSRKKPVPRWSRAGTPAGPHGYLVQELWGSQSVVAGGARTLRISSAGVIKATVPAMGVALYGAVLRG
jgi:hypothetical protein